MGVDLILHVLRCFEDGDITHVHNKVDPISDFETIMTELCLKDLESVEKRQAKMSSLMKKARNSGSTQEIKDLTAEEELLAIVRTALESGDYASIPHTIADARIDTIPLLTAKKGFILPTSVKMTLAATLIKITLITKHWSTILELTK